MPIALEALLGMEMIDQIEMLFDPNSTTVDLTHSSVNFGVYDYNQQFDTVDNLYAIEHQFINWSDITDSELSSEFAQMNERDRWPLITVEPFSKNNHTPISLLSDIIYGAYDIEISQICRTINKANTPVFLRWGHEMEGMTGRYPWAGAIEEIYIDAYQHVVTQCRLFAENGQVYFVWSPLGQSGSEMYYPGDEYVDYIGLPVFSFGEWEYMNYGTRRSFDQIFKPRYDIVSKFAKPIMIAEMGVTGTKKYQAKWLNDVVQNVDKYPLLHTVVLFNAVDTPNVWGDGLSTPDWDLNDLNFIRNLSESDNMTAPEE